MKKVLSILLTFVLILVMLAGCGSKETAKPEPTKETTTQTQTTTATTAEDTGIAKFGLGHITSIGSSKDLEAGKGALGQVDTVIAAVAFDKNGKVVKITIDTAQTKVQFNDDLTIKSDVKAEGKTKVELGDAYGMVKASKIGKEWYQQAEALGNWMVGKTIAEIKAMKTVKKDDAHPAIPDEADLKSSVTMTVHEFIEAVEEAANNAVEVKGAVKLGLGHNISIEKSKGATAEAGPLAQVDTVMAVTAFDKDGKVAGTVIDTAQTKIQFDKAGKVTTDKNGEFKTKVELKDGYGMIKASKIGKEWYQQAAALGQWMVGKSVDAIKAMKTAKKDDAHPAVPAETDLTSSVTVSVEHYVAAVEEASKNAK